MHIDESALAQKYNLIRYSVISSTQISSRTTAVIEKLRATSSDGQAANLVILRSKARTAAKLVSIVEIAKRELTNTGHKCFQYNALSSEMIEIERDPKKATNGAENGTAKAYESESEDAFETMAAESKTGTKKRLVPVVTIYLCGTSVKELKSSYGEQT